MYVHFWSIIYAQHNVRTLQKNFSYVESVQKFCSLCTQCTHCAPCKNIFHKIGSSQSFAHYAAHVRSRCWRELAVSNWLKMVHIQQIDRYIQCSTLLDTLVIGWSWQQIDRYVLLLKLVNSTDGRIYICQPSFHLSWKLLAEPTTASLPVYFNMYSYLYLYLVHATWWDI